MSSEAAEQAMRAAVNTLDDEAEREPAEVVLAQMLAEYDDEEQPRTPRHDAG